MLLDLFCLPEIIINNYIQDYTSFSQELALNKFEAKILFPALGQTENKAWVRFIRNNI